MGWLVFRYYICQNKSVPQIMKYVYLNHRNIVSLLLKRRQVIITARDDKGLF